MSFGASAPRVAHYLSIPLVSLLCIGAVAPVDAGQARPTILQAVNVRSGADVSVILVADAPINGHLQRIAGRPTRYFVDLQGVRPDVNPAITVNQGAVLRVRVGLNSMTPLVTRVVIEVTEDASARLQPSGKANELLVVVGMALGERPARRDPVQPDKAADDVKQMSAWVEQLDAMLQSTTSPTRWAEFESSVVGRAIGGKFATAHHLLLQAVRLARIAADYSDSRDREKANAALAGARLLLNTLRLRLEESGASK